MRLRWGKFLAGFFALTAAAGAQAAVVSWTDWTSAATSSVSGTLDVNGTPVGVGFSGVYSFAQTAGGTNYWSPSAPYVGAVVSNAPPASDIIGLNSGGIATITFSQPVVDPLIAVVSWNGNTVDFNTPIEFLSFGQGFWGNGIPMINAAGDGFFGSGEVHGTIRLPGTFTSISFSHTDENWHGLTVGIVGLAEPNGAPEPGTMALLALALGGLAIAGRRKRA